MCGFLSDPNHICQCTAQQLQRYRARVSGPLLDRIDIHVEVPPVRYADLTADEPAEPSTAIRQRVNAARERQQSRFAGTPVLHNAALGVRDIRQHFGSAKAKTDRPPMDMSAPGEITTSRFASASVSLWVSS